jgi:hypothetical protein
MSPAIMPWRALQPDVSSGITGQKQRKGKHQRRSRKTMLRDLPRLLRLVKIASPTHEVW